MPLAASASARSRSAWAQRSRTSRHDRVGDGVVVEGGLVAEEIERGHGDPVGLDVVGVAVEAVLVVGDDDLRPLLFNQVREAPGDVFDRRRPEGLGVVVLGPTHHARVAVPEAHVALDAEDLYRVVELDGPDLGDLVAVVVVGVGFHPAGRVTELAIRAGDEDCAHALVG